LREAAKAWVGGLHMPVRYSDDREFAALDRRLQRAAIAFAKASGRLT
jgi:hypothetical protein